MHFPRPWCDMWKECADSVFLALQSGVLYWRDCPLLKLLPTVSAPPIRGAHCVSHLCSSKQGKKTTLGEGRVFDLNRNTSVWYDKLHIFNLWEGSKTIHKWQQHKEQSRRYTIMFLFYHLKITYSVSQLQNLILHSWLSQHTVALSAGMWIKGKEKKHSPFLLPHQAPPISTVPFFLKMFILYKMFLKKKKVWPSTPQTWVPVLTPLFPCSQRQIFLESWELSKMGPHTVSEHSTAGGRQTHTHTHTSQNGGFDKIFPLSPKLLMNLLTTWLLGAVTVSSYTSHTSSYHGLRSCI